MIPVTHWTRLVKQPRGGYLPIKHMHVEKFDDGVELHEKENLNPGTVGTAIDYLSRALSGVDVGDVYSLPLKGAEHLGKKYLAGKYLSEIMMFTDDMEICPELVHAGVNLSRYDIAFKADARYLNALKGEVNLDDATMENIMTMLERILAFRRRHDMLRAKSCYLTYKPCRGLTGSDCLSGEIDILAPDAIWDCKAMASALRATYSLQLLAYYMMLGYKHGRDLPDDCSFKGFNPMSGTPEDFTLGFFNPRENQEYWIHVSEIDPVVFSKVDADMTNVVYFY